MESRAAADRRPAASRSWVVGRADIMHAYLQGYEARRVCMRTHTSLQKHVVVIQNETASF